MDIIIIPQNTMHFKFSLLLGWRKHLPLFAFPQQHPGVPTTCVDLICFTFILFLGMTIKLLKGLRSFTNGNERKMLPQEKQKSLLNVTNDVVTVTGVSVTLICICQKHMIRWCIPARHLIQRQSGFKTCDTLCQAAWEHLFLGARQGGTQ